MNGRGVSRLVLVVMLVAAGACHSGSYKLPDASSPEVKAEQARLALVIASREASDVGPSPVCQVRLLGQHGTVSYVWALCRARTGGAASFPARVDGQRVQTPRDGHYGEDVHKLFPAGLARLIDRDAASLYPNQD